MLLVASCSVMALAQAQPISCQEQGGRQVCTVASDVPLTVPLTQSNPSEDQAVTNNAVFSVGGAAGSSGIRILSIGANGVDDTDESRNGNASHGAMLTNNATIGLSLGTTAPTGMAVGLEVSAIGGDGVSQPRDNDNGGNGGSGGSTTLWNFSNITIEGGTLANGVMGAYVQSRGGAGGNDTTGIIDNYGGNGGSTSNIEMINRGNVSLGSASAYLDGGTRAWGVAAENVAGDGALNATGAVTDGSAAGQAGNAAGVQFTSVGNVNVFLSGTTDAADGVVGLLARSVGGRGGDTTWVYDNGGAGGRAGAVTVIAGDQALGSVSNVNVGVGQTVSGLSAGILAQSIGGLGGYQEWKDGDAGAGGSADAVNVALSWMNVSTTGDNVAGVIAFSRGGDGGSDDVGNSRGVNGGNGGQAGTATITLTSAGSASDQQTSVSTNGANAYGVVAQSIGGFGGLGTESGGIGQDAATVTITADANSNVTTQGDFAIGMLAQSIGGGGGTGEDFLRGLAGSDEDSGGNGGNGTTAIIHASGTVRTTGQHAYGIVAQSIGGSGGAGGLSSGIVANGGDGGAGGAGGSVTIDALSGAGAANVYTTGYSAIGVIGQSIGGGGGAAGSATGLISVGGSVSSAQNNGAADVSVAVNSVDTQGDAAIGILAQSIGGGGGSAGSAGGILAVGGSGESGGNGGAVTVDPGASIKTQGNYALGILAQSIGGGGGNGGDTMAVSVDYPSASIGGNAGQAGSASKVTVQNTNTSNTISTFGDGSIGVLAQSIGGGGGNGGSAKMDSVLSPVTVAIGGASGGGGDGAETDVTLTGTTLSTAGAAASGIVAQSIGGGGGNGGAAQSAGAGVGFQMGVAVGGKGGNGGKGGTVSVALDSVQLSTGGVGSTGQNVNAGASVAQSDSYGVVAQSIGGGGGNGGSAASSSLTVAVPDPDVSFAITANVGVGGSGGLGGEGGNVDVNLSNGAVIYTGGQGSHGVIVQSIGGGGGNGGASKAMSTDVAIPGDSVAVNVDVAVGGSGGSGGTAGAVSLEMGANTQIVTYDDLSNGVLAQSIGGGGGNAGIGSSSSGGIAQGKAFNVSVGVGGTGGRGGEGGTLTATLANSAAITTFGSGSRGMVLQSLGGGGGASQGTTVDLGGPVSIGGGGASADDPPSGKTKFNASVSVSVGASGAVAGDGGGVTLTSSGVINTTGGDADGILIQSIGGGGGLGGNAGSDASAGPVSYANPVSPDDPDSPNDPNNPDDPDNPDDPPDPQDNDLGSYALSVGVGGKGGAGGNGGTITFNYSGVTGTKGDFADGIILQSIGGGGGAGGASTAKGAKGGSNLDISVGGSGGAAGDGGDIVLNMGLGSSVTTGGDLSYGLLAQSIGGGGGQGAIGTNTLNTLSDTQKSSSIAVGVAGSGGNGGNGGNISMNAANSRLTVLTGGYDAHAIVLQSIGGGGGVGGASGTSITGNLNTEQYDLQLGGGGGVGNNMGGTVTVESWLNIVTTGEHAFGVVAQSIGGGGGIVSSGPAANIGSIKIGTPTTFLTNSGEVNVTLSSLPGINGNPPAPSAIVTQGRGAHGIVLQSIAGGGGIIGDTANGALVVDRAQGTDVVSTGQRSADVSLVLDGTITTSGAGAFGIIAQSLGASGGIGGDSSGSFAGALTNSRGGVSGAINLTLNGEVQTNGENAFAVFAQTIDTGSTTPAPVTITVSDTVWGGKTMNGQASGGAIWIDSPAASTITINEGGQVLGQAGLSAIQQTGLGSVNVINNGYLSGNVYTHANAGATATATEAFSSTPGTLLNAGTFARADTVRGHVVNRGQMFVGDSSGTGRTRVTNDFTQPADGVLNVSADFVGAQADMLTVDGQALLGGTVKVLASTLMPNKEVTVLQAGGLTSNHAMRGESSLFTYRSRQDGNTVRVAVDRARFNEVSDTYGVGSNLGAMGGHLQEMWDRGSNSDLGGLYASLNRLAGQGRDSYANALSDLSPGVLGAPGLLKQAEMVSFANALLSCPDFDGTTTRLGERDCVWGRVTSNTARVDANRGTSGFKSDAVMYQVGAQRSVAPNWFVGVAGAYENRSIRSDDRRQRVKGDSGYLGVSLKRESGPWTFAGTLSGSYGTYDNTRHIEFLGAKATSDSKVMSVAQRFRVSYTHAMEQAYIKPMVDLDVIHTRMPSFNERGAGGLNLHVKGVNKLSAVLSPGVEVGARLDTGRGYILRPYASVGVSVSTSDKWNTSARLADAPAGTNHFKSTMETGSVFGRVSGGVQVLSRKGVDVGLQYDGLFSSNVRSHAGSVKATWRF